MNLKDFNKKKNRILKKQLDRVEKEESKVLNKKEVRFLKNKTQPLQEKIEAKIPKKLEQTLEQAFEAGFKIVFEKGTGVIEKSYSKDEKNLTFEINHYAVLKQTTKKNLKKLDQTAQKSMLINQMFSTLEGGTLGVLGIGLPDIPLFIGMILKNIYEVSLSYGFDYTDQKEKIYILYLICAAVTKGEIQKSYSKLLDEVHMSYDEVMESSYNMDILIKEAAHQLAEAMLIAKFVQGIPVVGVIGGAYNFTIMKEINRMAKIKYKKRYLQKLKH